MSYALAPVLLAAATIGTILSIVFEVFTISTTSSSNGGAMKVSLFGLLALSILLNTLCLFLMKKIIRSPNSHDNNVVEALNSNGKRSIVDPIIQAVSSRSTKRRHRRRQRHPKNFLSILQQSKTDDGQRINEIDDVDIDEEVEETSSEQAALLPFSLSLSTTSITKLWEDLFLSPESAMKTPFRILKPEEEDELFFATTDQTTSENEDNTSNNDDHHSVVHFCFLVHGFRGHSRDLSYVQAVMRRKLALLQKSSRQLVVYSSQCNEKKTDDGVIAGGTRLFHEMLNVIRSEMSTRPNHFGNHTYAEHRILKPITISMWGNSLGGLYARYALSLLSEHFPVSSDEIDGATYWIIDDTYAVHLNIFCTTATPHLGISGHTFVALPRRAEIGLASALGVTGKDLFRINSILYDMATKSQYVNPLSLFRKRVCYANAYGTDFPVPASTAAFLSECSTYPHHVSDDNVPNDDSLVQIATLYTIQNNRSSDNNHVLHVQNKDETVASLDTELAQMSISLDSLGWKKVFVDMRKEVPHIVLPKSLIRGGSGSKSIFSSMTSKASNSSIPVQSMTYSTESERSSHGSNSSDDEEVDNTGPLTSSTSKVETKMSTYPIEPIHQMVKKRLLSSRYNSASRCIDNPTMTLTSKDVAAAVSTSALLFDAANSNKETIINNKSTANDERDEINDTTGCDNNNNCTLDETTHFAIHWPLGHNMIVAFSRSRWSAHMNKAGRPVVDALVDEIVNDIFAFQPNTTTTNTTTTIISSIAHDTCTTNTTGSSHSR